MYQKTITEREAGQRFDKYLRKLLPEAGSGFLYKMLRKKNIVLNDKKADGSEKLVCGDIVSVYFSKETLDKFMKSPKESITAVITDIAVLYENDHILIADKPAGILTQKASREDFSVNEWLLSYLLNSDQITEEELQTFKPSVCNRLDRNTSGIVLCSKTIQGAQMLGEALKKRSLHKFYKLYVKGCITEERVIEGYLCKDEKHNKVRIYSESFPGSEDRKISDKESYIKTRYLPLRQERDKTLLEVELITGKAHQIRAHLASIGHPLLGDYKYGDRNWNENYKNGYGITHQLLHAYKVVFPHMDSPFEDISDRAILAPLPEIFDRVADK